MTLRLGEIGIGKYPFSVLVYVFLHIGFNNAFLCNSAVVDKLSRTTYLIRANFMPTLTPTFTLTPHTPTLKQHAHACFSLCPLL